MSKDLLTELVQYGNDYGIPRLVEIALQLEARILSLEAPLPAPREAQEEAQAPKA